MFFLDTSALVKIYLGENGTDAVQAIVNGMPGRLYLSKHVALETLATFAYKLRDQRIQRRRYQEIRSEFFGVYPRLFHVLPVTDEIVSRAMNLADRHRDLGVGTVDLIHVATAIQLRSELDSGDPLTIVCADRSMRLLARAAGFEVFDPETDDVARLGVPPDEA